MRPARRRRPSARPIRVVAPPKVEPTHVVRVPLYAAVARAFQDAERIPRSR